MNKDTCICGEEAWRHCPRCLTKSYCSRECQDKDWEKHKGSCISFRDTPSGGGPSAGASSDDFKDLGDGTFEFTSADGAKKALEMLSGSFQ